MRKLLIQNLDQVPPIRRVGAKLREWTFDNSLWEGKTPQQIKDELADEGLEFDNGVDGVVVTQSQNNMLHIVLPPADSLTSVIKEIKTDPPNYKIQKHYFHFVRDRDSGGDLFDEESEVLDFYDFRLGDYTLQHCM